MGIIDSTKHTLSCAKCGTTESVMVLDKGSNFGGSSWHIQSDFSEFDVGWESGRNAADDPKIVCATCKKCGGNAAHKDEYGGV
jgi:hypothetical protein